MGHQNSNSTNTLTPWWTMVVDEMSVCWMMLEIDQIPHTKKQIVELVVTFHAINIVITVF
jgi:hypothetical protein